MRSSGSRGPSGASGWRAGAIAALGAMLGVGCALSRAPALADDPWAASEAVQLSLWGDQRCSDPLWGELASECCVEHDLCFALGGGSKAFHLCNDRFLGCMLRAGMDPDVALVRWWVVERFGERSFDWHEGEPSP